MLFWRVYLRLLTCGVFDCQLCTSMLSPRAIFRELFSRALTTNKWVSNSSADTDLYWIVVINGCADRCSGTNALSISAAAINIFYSLTQTLTHWLTSSLSLLISEWFACWRARLCSASTFWVLTWIEPAMYRLSPFWHLAPYLPLKLSVSMYVCMHV